MGKQHKEKIIVGRKQRKVRISQLMVKWAVCPFTFNPTLEKAEDLSWPHFQTCLVPQEEVIHFNNICQNLPVLHRQEGYGKEQIFLIIFLF